MRETVSSSRRHTIYVTVFSIAMFIVPTVWAQQTPFLDLGNPIGGGVRQNAPSVVHGRLSRVKNNQSGAQRLALLDSADQVVAFLAPTARFDVEEFLGQRVTVTARSSVQRSSGIPLVVIDSIAAVSGSNDWVPEQSPSQQPDVRHSSMEFDDDVDSYPGPNPVRNVSFDDGSVIDQTCHDGSCGSPAHEPAAIAGATPAEEWTDNGYFGDMPSMMDDMRGSYGDCGACSVHGPSCCDPGCCYRTAAMCIPQPPTCGPPGWLWMRGEYLLWWGNEMDIPALVTTGGSSPEVAGVLGQTDTTILYGNEKILDSSNSGFRISWGGFFGPQRKFGWESDFLRLSSNQETFFADTDSHPILARPFFNVNPRNAAGNLFPPAREDSQIVSYPDIASGSIKIDSSSDFSSAGGRARWNICCKQFCDACDTCGPFGLGFHRVGYQPFSSVSFLAGYRFYELKEDLTIHEDITKLNQPSQGARFEITDNFHTRNRFNGADLGFEWNAGINRWTFDFGTTVAIGSNKQEVSIAGKTKISEVGQAPETTEVGFLAGPDNIGSYSRNEFAMVPQVKMDLGFFLAPRFRVMVGYSVTYWGGIVRPGDQIDLDLDPDNFVPELNAGTGVDRPRFAFHENNFFMQGLNIGIDYRW